MDNISRFEAAVCGVAPEMKRVLLRLPAKVKSSAEEIRLRCGLPVALTVNGETVFVTENGQTSFCITKELLKAQRQDVLESFRLLCRNSVYAHEDELKNGFLILGGGHRAGICGSLSENGGMQRISSINIRIAKEIFGAANDIARCYSGGGLLIAGPPGSGKTTVLRDLIRQLADGLCGRIYRVVCIDSRGEISGSHGGICENYLGAGTDVLMTQNRAVGIEIAVRTMFPDVVAFDEISTLSELKGVSESFCAGVSVITTAHVGNEDELMQRNVTRSLIKSGAVDCVALLSGLHGGKIKLFGARELINRVAV